MWEPIDRQYLLQKGDQLTKFQLAKLKKSNDFVYYLITTQILGNCEIAVCAQLYATDQMDILDDRGRTII